MSRVAACAFLVLSFLVLTGCTGSRYALASDTPMPLRDSGMELKISCEVAAPDDVYYGETCALIFRIVADNSGDKPRDFDFSSARLLLDDGRLLRPAEMPGVKADDEILFEDRLRHIRLVESGPDGKVICAADAVPRSSGGLPITCVLDGRATILPHHFAAFTLVFSPGEPVERAKLVLRLAGPPSELKTEWRRAGK